MKPTTKSTSGADTDASGMTSRGKYTFEISGALITVLAATFPTAVAKKSHVTIPKSANTGYGTVVARSRCASRPKNSENTAASATGWTTAHDAPISDCL